MADYIIDTKKLSARIGTACRSQAKLNVEFHLLACSAMHLAIKDGRCNWLNELHASLPKIYQDAFRAWSAPNASHWFGKDIEDDQRWLKFESAGKDGKPARGFYVGKNMRRPELGTLDAIADDITKAFYNKSAQSAVDTNKAFDVDAYVRQFATMADKMAKLVEEKKIVLPTFVLQEAQKFAQTVAKNAKSAPVLATVDGKPVEPKVEAPVVAVSAAEAEKIVRKSRVTKDAAAVA